ncbi:hypothetical protein Tco_0901012 [Tanacetum coccineum]
MAGAMHKQLNLHLRLGGSRWSRRLMMKSMIEVELVNYALMAISSSSSSSSSDNEVQKCSKCLQKNYDTEREKHNKAKLEIRGYEIALESLEARILRHEKNDCLVRLGFGTQMDDLSNKSETDSENSLTVFKVRSSDEESTLANNSVYVKINMNEVIIEDWTSDDEDDVCVVKTVSSVEPNVTQAVRSQADKSGQNSQKQGIDFKKVHKIKACFVCKSIDHLIKDGDFYKSPKSRVKNMVITGERVVKPVWDYGKRVHQEKIRTYQEFLTSFHYNLIDRFVVKAVDQYVQAQNFGKCFSRKNDESRQAIEEERGDLIQKNGSSSYHAASTSTGANADESSFVYLGGKIPIDASTLPNGDLPINPNIPNLENVTDTLPNDRIFNGAYDDDEDVGTVADFNNMDNTIAVSPFPTLRIHKDHPKDKF